MTAIEKQFNRDELNAYKAFDNSTTAMVPGVSNPKRQAAASTPHKEGAYIDPDFVLSKKLGTDSIKKNNDRMAKYGLQNVGQQSLDNERHYRGAGGILGNNVIRSPQKSPSLEKLFKPEGGMFGAGALFPDGQIRENAEPLLFGADARKFSVSPNGMKPNSPPKTGPSSDQARQAQLDAYGVDPRAYQGVSREPRDQVTNMRALSPNTASKGLKVTTINNPANGHGIGVSFSNVHFSYA